MSIDEKSCSDSSQDPEAKAQAILDAELDKFVARRRDHEHQSLGFYHEVGSWLNRILGAPTKRLKYGGKVLERVEGAMKIAQSELSRMRWFAHLFKNVADLQRSCPGLETWTAFKKALPNLKGRKAQKTTLTSKTSTAKAKLVSAVKSVTGVTERVRQISDLGEAALVEPLMSLRLQVQALAECLSLTVTVPQD